jgi:TolB protein
VNRLSVIGYRLSVTSYRMARVAIALIVTAPVMSRAQDTATAPGVRIGLTYARGVRPGIVVMPVEPTGGDSVRTILERDLDYSDRFNVISLDTATLAGLTPRRGAGLNYQLFARFGAAAVVTAEPFDGGYRATVHDVAGGRSLASTSFSVLAQRYSPEWRMEIHGIADEIERWILGTRGIARTRILFVRGETLHIVDSDGANPRRMPASGSALSPAWHPSGSVVAYSRLGEGGSRIVLHDLRDGSRRTIRATASTLNITPTFTPDGRAVTYATGRTAGTEIVATPLSDLTVARLVTVGRGSDNTSPSFSPDGRRLAFTSGRAGRPQVYIADADGTNVQLMTEFTVGGSSYRASPAWSPDGRFIAYQAQAGGFQLMVVSLRDRTVRQLTAEGSNEDPSWAPDGRHLVFASTRSGTKQLWVVDIETGRMRQLTRASGARLAAWSPVLKEQQQLQASSGDPGND